MLSFLHQMHIAWWSAIAMNPDRKGAHLTPPHSGTRENSTNKTVKLNTCIAAAQNQSKKYPWQ
jgi:hypothetical protein